MTDDQTYIPISTQEAVEAVLSGEPLRRAEIADLRALIEGVQEEAAKRGIELEGDAYDAKPLVLRCPACRIVECDCRGLTIRIATGFLRATFTQDADFYRATFTQNAGFEGVTFTQNASFWHTTFTQDANFIGAMFTQDAGLYRATFTQNASFEGVTFTQNASFGGTTFTQDANFGGATFTQDANFGGVTFTQDANFSNTTFTQDAYFRDATFTRDAHFWRATASAAIRLREARLGAGGRLDFTGLELRPGGRVELSIEQIGRCRRKLIDGEDSRDPAVLADAAAQYNMLRDNFRSQPSTDEEEDRCHYKYMNLRRKGKESPQGRGAAWLLRWPWHHVSRFCDWFFLKWCYGYGIYTHRIGLAMLAVLALFSLVYALAAGPETIRGYFEVGADGLATERTDFSAAYFSVITFATIGYGDYAPMGWLRIAASVEGLLGLFLMALFTVSFARKLLR
ncbi:MAG: potassium channel family protein [Phycisphaerales bacterium]|nr:potassium channel family protein [Phycisphaerales bacterium]